ncbi:5'-nucleotidase, partial [Paraphysoderma sedebokerense]
GGRPIHVNDHISENQEISSLVKSWREPFEEIANSIIGKLNQRLYVRECWIGPCKLGYLITTAMLKTHKGKNTPIAVMNIRGIRQDLLERDIKYSAVQNLLPAGTSIVTLTVKGSYILDMLENFASEFNFQRQDYLRSPVHLANIRYDVKKTDNHQNRIKSVEIRNHNKEWEPMDENAYYDLLTNDFVARGGDNILPSVYPNVPQGKPLADAIIEYIKSVNVVEFKREDIRFQREIW